MQILIDGDSSNKLELIESVAQEHDMPCHIYCDTSHWLCSDYAEIHMVDKGADSADFALIGKCNSGDIVITRDNGLAAMVLAKKAFAVNPAGFEYTDKNIGAFLSARYLRKNSAHKTGKKQVKGIKRPKYKTTSLRTLLENVIKKGCECSV